MGSVQFLLCLLVSVACLKYCIGGDDVSLRLNDDVLGLIVFKSGIADPSSYLSSWNEDDDSPCSWKFIQCNPVTGRVSQVTLDGLGLSGKIGKGLQKLRDLKVLSLAHNNFSGSVSPELDFITSLERLNISHNSLSGPIPSSLSSIRFLDLSKNSFLGQVPDDLFRNCTLHYLSLADNLLQGSLLNISGCSSLNTLNLSHNQFSGVPDFSTGIWLLERLRTLDLSHNAFSGFVPKGVSSIHNLKDLRLQGNNFSGPIPADIGLCPHFRVMNLADNLFSGNLPDSLQRLTSLKYFSVSNNMLTGNLPAWIANLSSLEYLDLSSNGLTGSLPSSIGDLTSLKYMSLSNNKLTGKIPTTVGHCAALSVIRVRGNNFNGSIPESVFDLEMEEVDFSQNRLMGSIPTGSSKFFGSVRTLDLSNNCLTGQIPAEMGLSSNLRYLNLSWNNLNSKMPPELGYFQNLEVLDLRSSALVGPIPADICESRSLSILQLDGNSLTGPIPEEIGNCSSLYLLSLSHNNLSGSIPESMSNLKQLKILKLEVNRLTGEIPQELGKLENLLAVNISYNKLTGRLPVGSIFTSLDYSALQGNLGICSPLLKGPCKMNVPKPLVLDPFAYGRRMPDHRPGNEPSSSTIFHHGKFLSISAIVAISAAIFIVVGVVVISLLNISARRRPGFVDHALESMCSSSSRFGIPTTGKVVLFDPRSSPDCIKNPESLLKKAAEVGEGVFGAVYKVSLGSQGRMVAMKKLVTANIIQYPEDFDREVRVLGKARHPNLVSLEGYYWSPEMQLLIADYVPNGSLQAKLHERPPSSQPLTWASRFKIVIGTAQGLAYLHHSFRPPIIHYNIKPSNILLDENFTPKVADFGLARLLSKLDRHVMSNRFQSALGYVAPELACQSLRVNEKCDVYGFGILILELVTGRRPVEYGEHNVVILNDHVRVLLEEGNVWDCVDPSMGGCPEDEVLPVLKLALVCTSQIPSSRPSMAEVVQILQIIKTPASQRMEML
uniref:Leucine-rich repeat transmembrane protein kinase n=1 Tax=Rhizophora mucronata TaxID=61149 RepID=A0A2P2IPZ9_RHIMU